MPRILIIEDDPTILSGLEDTFQFHDFEVITAEDGIQGLRYARESGPDIIILDIMLPGVDGFDICKKLREQNIQVPIIILTARSQEGERLLGFELGADDYVTKPFSLKELVARVQAVLRRTQDRQKRKTMGHIGKACINYDNYTIEKDGQTLSCTSKEFGILKCLKDNPDRILSRDWIIEKVWGKDTFVTTRTIDNFIVKLRTKIEDDPRNPKHILTVHGVGYKFVS